MKITAGRVRSFCRNPDPPIVGVLLYGEDEGLVALRRRELVAAVTEDDPMRLTRVEPAEAQKAPGLVEDALLARGFFPGRRAVLIEGAKDGLTRALAPMLETLSPEDALLILTAGILPARSSLRKLFEGQGSLAACPLYSDPPAPMDIAEALAESGYATPLAPEAEGALLGLAAELDAGSFRQLIGTVALCGLDGGGVSAEDIARLAPQAREAAVDRVIDAAAEGLPERIAPLLARIEQAGTTAVSIVLAVSRHLRLLYAVQTDPRGVASALTARLPGGPRNPRRRMLERQLARWTPPRLEAAIRALHATDRQLRSTGTRPDRALVERCLLRIAIQADDRRR